jgi:hypothetical protein
MNYRQARELIEEALEEMAQTPSRRKQIHGQRKELLNKLYSTHSSDIEALRKLYPELHKLDKAEWGEKRSGWTYGIDGKKLRMGLGKKAKKINEGAVKDMMHDWIEKLPKGAVSEIKSRGSAEKQSGKSIASTLAKHKVKHLMDHPRHSVDAVKMMFDGIHGDLKESALGEMAQTPARRKQIVDKRADLMRQANAMPLDLPVPYPNFTSDFTSLILKHSALGKVGKRERASGWTYDIDGKKLRLGKKVKKVKKITEEAANPVVQSVVEAILAGDSARRSGLIQRRKAAKETMQRLEKEKREGRARGTFAKMVVTPTENIPAHIDPTKRLMKRKTDKRGIVAVKKPDFDTPAEAIKHNQKVAHDIISAIQSKPHGSPVNLYGRKHGGGTVEKKVRVSRKRIMGRDVHVIHGTDREVHLNPSGAGLQVIDAKSKRILMDRGNDADW